MSQASRLTTPDLRQTPEYANFLKYEGWKIQKIGQGWVYFRKLPLISFSIAKYQRPDRPDLEKYLALARKHRAVRVYFEPQVTPGVSRFAQATARRAELAPRGWSILRSSFLPTKTLQIDLTQPLDKIKARMKKDGRYGIRKAEEKGTKVQRCKSTKQRDNLRKAWQKTGLEKTPLGSLNEMRIFNFLSFFTPNPPLSAKTMAHLAEAFGEKAVFIAAVMNEPHRKKNTPGEFIRLASLSLGRSGTPPGWKNPRGESGHSGKTEILAGAIILLTNQTAYYYRAFTTRKGRKNYAQYLLVWEAIKTAKKVGCRVFDFEGIYDSRFPIKSWRGFSHFKESFGGKTVQYPGCFSTHRRGVRLLTPRRAG